MYLNNVLYSDFPRLRILFLSLQPHPTNLFYFPCWSGRIMVMKCKTQSFLSQLPTTEISPRVTSITRPETKQAKREIYLKISFLPLLIHSLLLMDRWASWCWLKELSAVLKYSVMLTAWHPKATPTHSAIPPQPIQQSWRLEGCLCGRTGLQNPLEAAGIPEA